MRVWFRTLAIRFHLRQRLREIYAMTFVLNHAAKMKWIKVMRGGGLKKVCISIN